MPRGLCYDCDTQAADKHQQSPACFCGNPKTPGDWLCARCHADAEAKNEHTHHNPDRAHES